MDKNILLDIINQVADNKISEITISGGEPFLYPNLSEIIRFANSKKIVVRIITNLSLINTDMAIDILKRGNFLQLTLDSTNEKENDKIRGFGCYEKIINLLNYAKKLKLSHRIVLRMNLSKLNVNNIQSFIDLSINNKIKHISIAFIANCGRGHNYEYAFNYNESLNEMIDIMEYLKNLSNKYKNAIDITYNNLEEQRSCPIFSDNDIDINPRIAPDGNVFFCSYFFGDENVLGNVFDDRLVNIINSQKFLDFKNRVKERKKNNNCENCIFKKICSCGCPAISYMNSNNILDIDTQCKMIKYFIKNKIKNKKGI